MITLAKKFHSFNRDEKGAATAWSIFWLLVFLILGGLVIDVSNAYRFKSALRATADASALAAIISYTEEQKYTDAFNATDSAQLTPSERGKRGGHLLANINMDPTANVNAVVPESQVIMGYWDGTTFTPEGSMASGLLVNAAKVTALRTAANSNPLQLLLGDKFADLGAWDVGASAVASVYIPFDCATKEGIMAGGSLILNGQDLTFIGDLCLHGEDMVSVTPNATWLSNSDGELPVISFGPEGDGLCEGQGSGNCETEQPYESVLDSQTGLTTQMVNPLANYMPDVESIYRYYGEAVTDPNSFLEFEKEQSRYLPKALLANPDRDVDSVDGQLLDVAIPLEEVLPAGATATKVNGVVRIAISPANFQTAANANFPMPQNVVYDIVPNSTCTNQGITLSGTLEAPINLNNVVINTSCRVIFDKNVTFSNSTLYTRYGQRQGENQAAIRGSEGVVLGGGSCADTSMGSYMVAYGDFEFASGLSLRSSRVVTRSDVHIAAQGDGSQGVQILAEGDVHINPGGPSGGGTWQGCPMGLGLDDVEVDYYYRLVL